MKFYEIIYEIYEICKPQDMKIARGPGFHFGIELYEMTSRNPGEIHQKSVVKLCLRASIVI